MYHLDRFNPNFEYNIVQFNLPEEGLLLVALNLDKSYEGEKPATFIHGGQVGELVRENNRMAIGFYESECNIDRTLGELNLTYNDHLNAFHPNKLNGTKPKKGEKYKYPAVVDFIDALNMTAQKQPDPENPDEELDVILIEEPNSKASMAIGQFPRHDAQAMFVELENGVEVWNLSLGPDLLSDKLYKLALADKRYFGSELLDWKRVLTWTDYTVVDKVIDEKVVTYLVGYNYGDLYSNHATYIGEIEFVDDSNKYSITKLLLDVDEQFKEVYAKAIESTISISTPKETISE
tara:strand:- start:36743 stop:37618 length:876 start_codon:yes stop_codon:yes gene_type:complete